MYRIAIDIPGKNRRHPQTFDDFDEAVEMAMALAKHFRGSHVRVFVIVQETMEAHYTLFDVKFPKITPLMQERIEAAFGSRCPI